MKVSLYFRRFSGVLSLLAIVSIIATSIYGGLAFAVTGAIDSSKKFAWGDTMGWINMAPTNAGVMVSDTDLTGYAWSSVYGWINFGPFANAPSVANTSSGIVSGYAWSPSLGWVSMNGVKISADGTFEGVSGTQGSTAGRITFDCQHCEVTTTWRPTKSGGVAPEPASPPNMSAKAVTPPPDVPQESSTKKDSKNPSVLFDVGVQPKKIKELNVWYWLSLFWVVIAGLLAVLFLFGIWRRRRKQAKNAPRI